MRSLLRNPIQRPNRLELPTIVGARTCPDRTNNGVTEVFPQSRVEDSTATKPDYRSNELHPLFVATRPGSRFDPGRDAAPSYESVANRNRFSCSLVTTNKGEQMTTSTAPSTVTKDPSAATLDIVRLLTGPPETRSFGLRLWDGRVEEPPAPPEFTLIIRRPGALRRMFLPPSELALGEAYVYDDFDIEGNLEAATTLQESLAGVLKSPRTMGRLVGLLLALPTDDIDEAKRSGGVQNLFGRLHTRGRDAAAVRHHYDVGNDFYALWLGKNMVYSCAYFRTGKETIDEAQEAKLDLICRKLRLKPGETLLDIGCGWGALVRFAAEHYGVRASGITLSRPQAELATESIRSAGLEKKASIQVLDYRDMPRQAVFDKVVSVGMFEHVEGLSYRRISGRRSD